MTSKNNTQITSVHFDMNKKLFQFSQINEKTCLDTQIPDEFLIDITDTRNIWRYFTLNDGEETLDGKKYKKYEFSLEEVEKKLNDKLPQVYFYFDQEENTLEKISMKLVDESLNFEKIKIDTDNEENWNFVERKDCFKKEEDFRRAVKIQQDGIFGLTKTMSEFFETIMGRIFD